MGQPQHILFARSLSGRGKRFVQRIYPVRCVGLFLGFFAVAAGFHQVGIEGWPWAILVAYAFGWPHIAYQVALRDKEPYLAERRSLIVDSMFGGWWLATMQFNLVPGMVVLAMLSMNSVSAGGLRLLCTGILAAVGGAAAGLAVFGWHPVFEATLPTILASLPMLVFYPIALGFVNYGMSTKLASSSRVFEYLSQHDSLTGLPNRSHWKALVNQEFQRCRGGGRNACVVMIDLDKFKPVNDTYGHQAGDGVLQGFADLVSRHLRSGDQFGRYGGDEFGILLPQTSGPEAEQQVGRLLQLIREDARGTLRGCTASAGIVAYSPEILDYEAWIVLADKMLYDAKHEGRARLSRYEGADAAAP